MSLIMPKCLKFWEGYEQYALVVFLFFVIVIITSISNGANITDGIDGLATGTSAIIGITLAILAYVSGNTVIADYLNIMYIPNSGELVIFAGAFVGACVGFLWYNSYPAQVFMGDTGSLAIGGIIAVFAIMIRKELMLPVLCGVFLIEKRVGYYAGIAGLNTPRKIRRGQADIFNGTAASPLSEKRFPRSKDRYALLDHRDPAGHYNGYNIEVEVELKGKRRKLIKKPPSHLIRVG
jgi:UDP-N-acetylmuramyl pentapeptide phosphotransferase/UDP-N-acetylglucosamine-1-phosphate transferase